MGWALDSEVEVALGCIKRKNPVVFDVGANVGDWSQSYRSKKSDGRLFMFEPQIPCQEAIKNKHIPDSELIESAVGKEKSRLKMFSSSPTDGSASFHKREDSFFEDNTYEEYQVEVISLDDFIEAKQIEFVDYIKFDIEGHELEALLGLSKALSKKAIGAFSFEFGSGNLNSRTCFRDFWNLLSSDFDIFIITPSGRLDGITEYYEDMEFYRGVSNFVALLKK